MRGFRADGFDDPDIDMFGDGAPLGMHGDLAEPCLAIVPWTPPLRFGHASEREAGSLVSPPTADGRFPLPTSDRSDCDASR
eukprot:4547514-Pyramimonas_sp.AAC.1